MKKTNSAYLLAILTACLLLPSTVLAIEFTSLGNLIQSFTSTVVKALGALFMALAMVAFLFGIARYIWAIREGNEQDISKGKQFMMWGLIALFVMFSVYGIVKWAQTQIGLPDTTTIRIPDINFSGSGAQVAPTSGGAQGAAGTQVTPSSGGVGGAVGATLILEDNGWKYYSDGTSIGPDGTYYYQGQEVLKPTTP